MLASTIGTSNPLRYRGYVYDRETGLYYLQSRYYNPKIGRFINADALVSTGQGLLGNNMFAYCLNNPVSCFDPTGTATATCYSDDRPLVGTLRNHAGGAADILAVVIAVALVYEISSKSIPKTIEFVEAKVEAEDTSKYIYTVYFLYAEGGNPNEIIYVGRVKTANFGSRMSYHKTQGRRCSFCISRLDYAQCRAIEQGGMVFWHTINSDNSLHNQIRGISPRNGNRFMYTDAVLEMIKAGRYPENCFLPESYWANFYENELLNFYG